MLCRDHKTVSPAYRDTTDPNLSGQQTPSSDPHHPHPLRVDHRCSSIRRTRRSVREPSLGCASCRSRCTILTLRCWGYRRCSDAWSTELRSRGHPIDRWRVEGGLLHGWDGAVLRRERRGVGVGWSEAYEERKAARVSKRKVTTRCAKMSSPARNRKQAELAFSPQRSTAQARNRD
jgi:hypothetical protein